MKQQVEWCWSETAMVVVVVVVVAAAVVVSIICWFNIYYIGHKCCNYKRMRHKVGSETGLIM